MAQTVQQALQSATKRLHNAGVDSAALDAAVLLEHVTGLDKTQRITCADKELSDEENNTFKTLVHRREQHEPVAYITGKKEFWGFEFDTPKGVLIPRPDTETLIAAVQAVTDPDSTATIADVGVGSGAIILTLLKLFPKWEGMGVDVSDTALKTTAQNALNLEVEDRLHLFKGEWLAPITEAVDIIVSNPPYIPKSEVEGLMPDVQKFEPHTALDGGDDGLDAYRVLIPQTCGKLKKNGLLALEVGAGQAPAVCDLLKQEKKWHNIQCIKDLAQIDRVVLAQRH